MELYDLKKHDSRLGDKTINPDTWFKRDFGAAGSLKHLKDNAFQLRRLPAVGDLGLG